ncbi:AMP-binding enzyme [Alkalihalophilus marmarensis]|uniref:AMP-binding enzyme n=1 Tax=Alkalihalophilus marmarensis TaxID=521377 RepID=UPI002E1C171B|nr:hypothetical protein [Alkalihalophilus marmarensis]
MLTFGATFKQKAEKFKVKPAVIGVPNPIWGESVKAVGVLKEGTVLTSEEIIEFCNGRLPSYKKPKSVEFVDELPRNPSGKILKIELRETYSNEH